MATWQAVHDRASARRMRQVVLMLVAALMLWPAGGAHAVHEPVGACSPGFTNIRNVDAETFFDGRNNLTICLTGDVEDLGNHEIRWSNMSHVTIRSAPGHWRAIRSRIWIDDTSNDVTFYGLTLDSSGYDEVPGESGVVVNGDRVALKRNLITNRYGVAGSCINNDGGRGVADDMVIAGNRIFDCGADETHDHGIYTNAMNRPVIQANWIYENAGRGVNLGPATHNSRITRNVIADNCANPMGGVNDCSANIMYWGSTRFTAFNTNTIAFPHHRYNLAGCDFTDTESCQEWTGSNNLVERSCFYSTVSGYSGAPPGSGISSGWDGRFGRVDPTTITVTNPQFRNRTTPAHAWRDYSIPPANPCAGYQPVGPVGPPG